MEEKDVILITGSSGFIGSALINKLAGRARLVGFDKIAGGTPPPAAECVCIDLTSQDAIGALAFTVAVIAMAEVGRVLRLANVLFGIWLIAAAWLLAGGSTVATAAGVVSGLVLITLSLPRGERSQEHYGSWDRFVV
jgi:hypothetical protein